MIKNLKENEIFVFGSNEAGRHGAGAAKTALKWGAKYGVGVGHRGSTYAIPTKDRQIKTLSLDIIQKYVNAFIKYAEMSPEKIFLVTEIGCGLAGYNPCDIAPLFKNANNIENIILPKSFQNVLRRYDGK